MQLLAEDLKKKIPPLYSTEVERDLLFNNIPAKEVAKYDTERN